MLTPFVVCLGIANILATPAIVLAAWHLSAATKPGAEVGKPPGQATGETYWEPGASEVRLAA